ncbi:putative integral membrane protein (TIGR00698 family) [Isoptericola jiangsuensis]|uniref:Putative integral membrane protein (TIGR00698 family) n=1 Tax=Isoptericola jiangsuensis TaxID=548579 RepID=A0A2A9EYI0_9MICO|nr:putative sulfate exporter family transporter [Isoptericola jiangsuensis]PFG43813.1 putative integral membrane protein (TIGR00698 family) [Isoptericola jiangsuensis]
MARPLPGLALTAAATAALLAAAPALARTAPSLSPLVLALLLGALAGSLLGAGSRRAVHGRGTAGPAAARVLAATRPGTDWAARHLLRAGVVLLGLQLAVGDVLGLGWRGLLVVAVTVATTFTATLALGRRLGVDRDTSLLVATGFSICGAAAISAMTGVVDRTPRAARAHADGTTEPEHDTATAVATALALVALCGTAAVVVLPWLAGVLGLTPEQAGLWIGASVQEVAQVVAAAGTVAGTAALATATVAKLARVVLLAPLVAAVGSARGRRAALAAPDPGAGPRPRGGRPAAVPGFVVGFLGAVLLRSLGVLPAGVLDVAAHVTTALFVAAMFALGLGVDVPRLVRTGRRPLVLGLCSALVVTGTSLVAVLALT